MSLLFLLPSLGYGLILFTTSGNAMLLWLSMATMAVWLLHSQRKSLDLSQQVSFVEDRVWIGERRLGLFPPLWGTEVRNKVYQAAFEVEPMSQIDLESFFASNIGLTRQGAGVSQPISATHPHAILIGPTGSGKTELMKLIAQQYRAPIWAIDFKGGSGFRDSTGVTSLVTDQNTEAISDWQEQLSLRQLAPLNPRLLLVIDELGEALKNPAVARLIEQVATKGRSLNVMLVAANQTLSQIPRSIWVNCANRISVSADLVDRSQLGFAGKPPDPTPGMGTAELWRTGGQQDFSFPFGFRNEKTASEFSEAVNPLLSRVSTKQL